LLSHKLYIEFLTVSYSKTLLLNPIRSFVCHILYIVDPPVDKDNESDFPYCYQQKKQIKPVACKRFECLKANKKQSLFGNPPYLKSLDHEKPNFAL
jgi:hypothetical protein